MGIQTCHALICFYAPAYSLFAEPFREDATTDGEPVDHHVHTLVLPGVVGLATTGALLSVRLDAPPLA